MYECPFHVTPVSERISTTTNSTCNLIVIFVSTLNSQWEGSAVATMSGKEALFVAAVAASKRGKSIIDDKKYDALKSELKASGSWVVTEKMDSYSQTGVIDTFLGYLYRVPKV
jgi:hypothetical protein